MGNLISTNEEHLANVVSQLLPSEKAVLRPARSTGRLLDLFVVPVGMNVSLASAGTLQLYWIASFRAVEFHSRVWQASPDAASEYR